MPNETTEAAAIERERQLILDAKARGTGPKLWAYTRLSGPGWLQSAITLGGGSLAGSLYLGILGGVALLWAQPVAMILGVIMLSAISYVTLSTGERPFDAINRHVNPVLGWGWALATMAANLVWSLPQFSLGAAALRQNLLPGLLGSEAVPDTVGKVIACGGILVVCVVVVWFYDSGRKGIRFFEYVLKFMVGVIIVCFFGVVLRMSLAGEGLGWAHILRGFIPDLKLLSAPAKTFTPYISAVAPEFQGFWRSMIVGQQRDVIITVTATAVGINMTFLLPYSMLRKGWDRHFRGLAIFDLSTGLFVPFILATSCVVIASATQFHARPSAGLLGESDENGQPIVASQAVVAKFSKIASARVQHELGGPAFDQMSAAETAAAIDALPVADRTMAAMLVKRDAFDLARSLSPLTGDVFAHYVFGIGVIGMAISSIIILMLINGFVITEILGLESGGWGHRLGSMMPAIGALAPFIWTGGKAQFWLAVPTSVFGMVLIPIAYCTFFLLINQKSLLGDNLPKGGRRILWNVLMAVAILWTGFGSMYAVWSKAHWWGMGGVGIFILLAVVVDIGRRRRGSSGTPQAGGGS